MESWLIQNGGTLSIAGVVLAAFGTIVAAVGSHYSGKAASEKTEEIAKLALKNAELSAEIADYARGGDSFFSVEVRDLDSPTPVAALRHEGKHPVRNASIEIWEVTDQTPEIAAGRQSSYKYSHSPLRSIGMLDVYPHGFRKLSAFPFVGYNGGDFHAYLISIHAENGTFTQLLQIEKVNGEWLHAYVMHRIEPSGSRGEQVARSFSSGFPFGRPGRFNKDWTVAVDESE